MRDYKNVKVPRMYRPGAQQKSVKRVQVGRGLGRSGQRAAGLKSRALQFLVVVVLATSCWLGWQAYQAITHAKMFQVAGVDVSGVSHLNESDLKEIVGVFTGQNIFRVDLAVAVRRASANSWVKEVRIRRRLPNRISMVVTERVPIAILDTSMGRYLLDDERMVIDRLAKEDSAPRQLPVVAIMDYRARLGEQVTSDGMHEALTFISALAARGGWQLAEVTIKASSPESLSVVYAEQEFKIGSGNYAEKLRRLAEIMSDVKQRGLDIAYVDLRPERQAAVMVKQSSK